MHYANARALDHDRAFTEFAGRSGQDGDAVSHQSLAHGVSAYAAGNPREFVAEVFTGLVYGKPFSPEIMRMYHGLGGPTPTPNRAPSAAPPPTVDGPAIAPPRAPRPLPCRALPSTAVQPSSATGRSRRQGMPRRPTRFVILR
ncbi:hypothetical protein HEK616_79210 (plasmid) [Streptomyces nigrescens]|uniref:Uncharacterized protein n=1 Tax=Streptomyces nigrescens TaxID=1920 RepID=A0ABN6RCS3_STRNI|nr:hypothetical protein HEK616_79210 [Streptomyces nigrescens]